MNVWSVSMKIFAKATAIRQKFLRKRTECSKKSGYSRPHGSVHQYGIAQNDTERRKRSEKEQHTD